MTKPLTLLLSGLFAALCWTAADMLLVGFVQSPEQYPLFSHTLASALGDDVDLAVLMLAGSPQRLFWGVLPATFSLPFIGPRLSVCAVCCAARRQVRC